MQALVVGGTGTVGQQVVRGLLSRGIGTRVLTRTPDKMRLLPRGAEGQIGDLDRASTLAAAFEGVQAVFVATATGPRESEQGIAAVRASRAAGVDRFIYLSIFHLEDGLHIPQFASKVPIEHEIGESGFAATVLRASTFFQNDARLREVIAEHGIYPKPIGRAGVSSVDVRDIADAAVEAMTGLGRTPVTATGPKPVTAPGSEQTYHTVPIAGPRAWTGPEVAVLYAKHLGRPVGYPGDEMEGWAEKARETMSAERVRDTRALLELFQSGGLRASEAEVAESERAVGHRMRTFEAYVAELVASWRS